jgi:hypothetical protein
MSEGVKDSSVPAFDPEHGKQPVEARVAELVAEEIKPAASGRNAVLLYVSGALLASAIPALREMTSEKWTAMSVFQHLAFFGDIGLATVIALKAATSSSTRPKQ